MKKCFDYCIGRIQYVILILTAALLFATCFGDAALADSARTLQETYCTLDPEEKIEFPEEQDFSGWIGILQSTEYEIIKEEPILVKKTDTIQKDLSWSPKPPEAEETIEEQGRTYHLQNISTEETPKTGRTALVTEKVRYLGYMEEPHVKKRRTTEYDDHETGQRIAAELPLAEIKHTGTYWRDDVTFSLHIEDVIADYYELGEDRLSPGTLPEEKHYPAILKLLELDPDKYRIRSIEREDGAKDILYGKAERYASDYLAVYETEIPLPDIPGYTGTATYMGEWEEPTGETQYMIRATGIYREKEKWPVLPAAGGAAATGGIIGIVILIRKRKHRQNPQTRKQK